MLTILVTENNELITSVKERIMQRSKCVDKLHFLVSPTYKDLDMSDFTVMLEYKLPISNEYHSELLTLSDSLYKDMLEYTLPLDTYLTKEPGNIKVQLTFTKVDLDENGENFQYVRKTSEGIISITPISAWSDIISDDALNAVDMALLHIEGKIKELEEVEANITDSTPSDIVEQDGSLQLVVGDKVIGTGVKLLNNDRDIDDEDNDAAIDLDKIMPDVYI